MRRAIFRNPSAPPRETLALPIYPELTQAQLDHVVASVAEFYRRRAVQGSPRRR